MLENQGKQTVTVAQSSNSLTLEAAGQPPLTPDPRTAFVRTHFGPVMASTGVTQQVTIGASQRMVLEVKWRFVTAPKPAKNYPWKIRISGLSVDGKPAADIAVARPVDPN